MDEAETKQKALSYSEKHNVTKEVITAVAGAAQTELDYEKLEREDGKMCSLFEEIANEGRLEGTAKTIIDMSIEFHIAPEDILKRLQQKLNISLQDAQKYLDTYMPTAAP